MDGSYPGLPSPELIDLLNADKVLRAAQDKCSPCLDVEDMVGYGILSHARKNLHDKLKLYLTWNAQL